MLEVRALKRPELEAGPFQLADGECLAVRGPSGAGKTLFLRALADLDPNEGDVWLDGRARAATPAPEWRRRVTYVAAEPGWWADTVAEHFADWAAASPLVTELGLPAECRLWPVARLSSGERQRLGLVRVLVQSPRVLLLDEPTGALDTEAAGAVERLLAERFGAGTSALWVTHDADQARRVAVRGLMVEQGRVSGAVT